MNWVQYKDLLCYMCLCRSVVSSLSLTQEVLGFNPEIFLLIFNFLPLNSPNPVKTFRENSNKSHAESPPITVNLTYQLAEITGVRHIFEFFRFILANEFTEFNEYLFR